MFRILVLLALLLPCVALAQPSSVGPGPVPPLPASAYSISGDCTGTGTGSIMIPVICLKTNGVAFGTAATVNTGTSGGTVPLLNAAAAVSGAWTFGPITASSYNGNYSVAGPPDQYGENNWQSSFNWPIAAAGGCCRTRRWVDNVTVTGNQAGLNVLETNFWDLEIGGTGTLTAEAFNQVHPYVNIGAGVTLSGYAGQFEGSATNNGTVNAFQAAYMLYTNSASATTGAYTGYTVGATNNNVAAASLGAFNGFQCTGIGGGGSAPTYNWCLVNRDSTASIVSAGGVRIGGLGNSNGPGTLAIYGPDTAGGTYPFFVKSSTSNLFGISDAGGAYLYLGDFTVSNGAVTAARLKLNGATSGTAIIVTQATAGTPTLTLPTTTGTIALTQTYASYQATPANPSGTTNTTGVMMGLAGAITPSSSGKVLITITGTIANATAIADGAKVQIRYGTGGAPANAAALTGTAVGSLQQYVAATTAETAPFSITAVVTGLTVSTAYWLDVGLAAITGGTATITGVSITATELP